MGVNRIRLCIAVCFLLASAAHAARAEGVPSTKALASWNDTPRRTAILEFVRKVTTEGGADYVPPAERIAVFDNDGTLWCEQPAYVQAAFVKARVHALAPQHPEWAEQPSFRAVLDDDRAALAASGEKGIAELMIATHSGMTTDEFASTVKEWLRSARHPKFQRPYTELVYRPMLELIDHLRANGFRVYIVSGGGVEFMRPWAETVYGIPPENVIGSSGRLRFEAGETQPVLRKLPEVDLVDDGPGKPVGIQQRIGRRPVAAFGNSDGDLQMLQWATGGGGPRLGMIVHHDDAEREFAYDRHSHVGRLDKAWDEAAVRGWHLVSMKSDWKVVFAP